MTVTANTASLQDSGRSSRNRSVSRGSRRTAASSKQQHGRSTGSCGAVQSFLDSLHGVSWSPLENCFPELDKFMGDQISGDEAEWLDCIIFQSTLATSIVAYLESVPWASLTAAGLCEVDTSFLTAMQACHILGQLFAGALSKAGRSSLRGALLLTQVLHHLPLPAHFCRNGVIAGVTFACIPFQYIHSVIHQLDRYLRQFRLPSLYSFRGNMP